MATGREAREAGCFICDGEERGARLLAGLAMGGVELRAFWRLLPNATRI